MKRELVQRTRDEVKSLARARLDWVTFSSEATEVLRRAVAFDRSCWHMVDPGKVLFTGTLHQNICCSGSWLAEHEYVIEDVTKWSFLARSGRLAGAISIATHGDRSRSARHRSGEANGIGDELRGSFLVQGNCWAAAGFIRDSDRPWFTDDDVQLLRALSEPIAEGFRRALLVAAVVDDGPMDDGPGVVIFDARGRVESISPAAERWIEQLIEVPPPHVPAESKPLQVVAARARAAHAGEDPLELAARSRVQTRSGRWLLLYGTRLSGGGNGRTAVIIQPAAVYEVAPLVALAYGLTERERQITARCMNGESTKQMAQTLGVSAHTHPGPPQVDLREDRGPEPRRARGPGLPRALRPALGGPARRARRMGRKRCALPERRSRTPSRLRTGVNLRSSGAGTMRERRLEFAQRLSADA